MSKLVVLLLCVGFSVEAKIYDGFMFFHEMELLELRLHELYNSVDKFILVESVETFQGNPKPLYYLENKERFAPFADKIIHVIVEAIDTQNPWTRERYQRDAIARGLFDAEASDILLISDLDEIPRASVLPAVVSILSNNKRGVAFRQTVYRFFLNMKDAGLWHGTVGSTVGFFRSRGKGIHDMRANREDFFEIKNGGWHFTSMGGREKLQEKLEGFSHTEYNVAENKVEKFMAAFPCDVVPIDASYPQFVLEHIDDFQRQGFILPLP